MPSTRQEGNMMFRPRTTRLSKHPKIEPKTNLYGLK